jgi:hypothetical protein
MILSTGFFFTIHAQSCHGGGNSSVQQPVPSEKRAQETEAPQTIQTLCPVMGKPVDQQFFVIWEGNEKFTPKRVYLCCNDCLKKINKHPERYVKKLYRMNQHVENVFTQNDGAPK